MRHPLTSWTFDQRRQELRSPAGVVVSVREICQLLADRRDCRYDFAGHWSGWTMRRQFLIPPHSGRNSPKLTPENARRFAEWVNEPLAALDASKPSTSTRPRLHIVR